MTLNITMWHERQIIRNTRRVIQFVQSCWKCELIHSDKEHMSACLGRERGDGGERNYKGVQVNFCESHVCSLIFIVVMVSWRYIYVKIYPAIQFNKFSLLYANYILVTLSKKQLSQRGLLWNPSSPEEEAIYHDPECPLYILAGYANNIKPGCSSSGHLSGLYLQQATLRDEVTSPCTQTAGLRIAHYGSGSPLSLGFLPVGRTHCTHHHTGHTASPTRLADRGYQQTNMPIHMLLAVPWVTSPFALTQESHVFLQYSEGFGRLAFLSRVNPQILHSSWTPPIWIIFPWIFSPNNLFFAFFAFATISNYTCLKYVSPTWL